MGVQDDITLYCRWEGCRAIAATEAALFEHLRRSHNPSKPVFRPSGQSCASHEFTCKWIGCSIPVSCAREQGSCAIERHLHEHSVAGSSSSSVSERNQYSSLSPHRNNPTFGGDNATAQAHPEPQQIFCLWKKCTAKFTEPTDLLKHLRSKARNLPSRSTKVDEIVCRWRGCRRILTRDGSSYHFRKHLPEDYKPYACKECPERFAIAQKLAWHRSTVHFKDVASGEQDSSPTSMLKRKCSKTDARLGDTTKKSREDLVQPRPGPRPMLKEPIQRQDQVLAAAPRLPANIISSPPAHKILLPRLIGQLALPPMPEELQSDDEGGQRSPMQPLFPPQDTGLLTSPRHVLPRPRLPLLERPSLQAVAPVSRPLLPSESSSPLVLERPTLPAVVPLSPPTNPPVAHSPLSPPPEQPSPPANNGASSSSIYATAPIQPSPGKTPSNSKAWPDSPDWHSRYMAFVDPDLIELDQDWLNLPKKLHMKTRALNKMLMPSNNVRPSEGRVAGEDLDVDWVFS